ncbi:hypothetical protein N7510_000013 [Penicillium lagena]|uniref:uncharacterized protein n=1 Tax=Penicillium lagena TaxID=94218 RepID=UPI00253FB960|nr:uncharacterized protein N7510_011832 [Penicillium lagena]XP_056837060.1 uncharacterized protein N7510_000013 [Penicillium lagena]KAJ5598882.1 hypothetical protein N7510_011832 [Penicillium lagena]KAJ5623704.1 hypothetical protein N7510_000013 [Penicillium lagena]
MSLPTTTSTWAVHGTGPGAGTSALKWKEDQASIIVKPNRCTGEISGRLTELPRSLCQGTYPRKVKEGVVAGSDGAGEVLAVGSRVSRFKKGDHVVTAFYQDFFSGPAPTKSIADKALGGSADGTFRQFGVFDEQGLLHLPPNLNFQEGATLSPLLQWTGGVSLFAIQFALAAGATVIATTSSETKAQNLREIGAHHIINYRDERNWGRKAKQLSPQGLGCHRIIEVGGHNTIKQSLEAVTPGGHVAIIGFLTGMDKGEDHPSLLEPFSRTCVVRGIEMGNRAQFEEMIRAIGVNNIHPVIDPAVFSFQELPAAFKYQFEQKHMGKVVVNIS